MALFIILTVHLFFNGNAILSYESLKLFINNIFVISIFFIIAIPEGIPLAITTILSFTLSKLLREKY